MNRLIIPAAALLAATVSTPALAQTTAEEEFNGPYVGGSFGYGVQNNDVGESVLFDRGFDGSFDTVTTTTGGNAFSPGFCNGAATQSANLACRNDRDAIEYHARIGWDVAYGNFVVGVLGEIGRSEVRDSVTAFSTTPAFYTMTREVDYTANVRARAGYAAGGKTLFYGTFGPAYAQLKNSFATNNGTNAFADNGKSDTLGFVAGGGVEQKIGRNLSLGLEYLYTRFQDDDYRVRVTAGTSLASNPFVLNGLPGTEFQRSDPRFDYHGIRATAAFRF